jgi:hypothetical protein
VSRSRNCHKRPVWCGGDVNNAQGTCEQCHHAFVWPDRPQTKRGTRTMREAAAPAPLWELGVQLEMERLSQEWDSEDTTP